MEVLAQAVEDEPLVLAREAGPRFAKLHVQVVGKDEAVDELLAAVPARAAHDAPGEDREDDAEEDQRDELHVHCFYSPCCFSCGATTACGGFMTAA